VLQESNHLLEPKSGRQDKQQGLVHFFPAQLRAGCYHIPMFKSEKLDEVIQQFSRLLPADLQQARQDIEKNLKSALSASLARMDLVTREEFDVQSELLARTRALLGELEDKVTRLEAQLEKRNTG